MKEQILTASLLHFEAARAEAQTNLNIYLNSPAGVAEHPDVVKEVVELTKKLAEAEECIQVLKNNF